MNVVEYLRGRDLCGLSDGFDDPQIRLVEEVEVDVAGLQAIGAERLPHDLLEPPHRLGEHRPAVHPGSGAAVVDLLLGHQGIRRVPVDLRVELADDGRVGVEVVGDEPAPGARIDRLEDHRPRPVREEHRHVASTVRVLHASGVHGLHEPVEVTEVVHVAHRVRRAQMFCRRP